MSLAKKIVLPSVFTALLIGGQFALSGVRGVEVVTVLLLSFAFRYGIKQGLLVANAFSILRCFIFGFFPTVIALYLIYYNLFVIVFGALGYAFKRKYGIKAHVCAVVLAALTTFSFTLIDDVLTPLVFGFSLNAAKSYFYASIPTAIAQTVCAVLTTLFLFPVIIKVLK